MHMWVGTPFPSPILMGSVESTTLTSPLELQMSTSEELNSPVVLLPQSLALDWDQKKRWLQARWPEVLAWQPCMMVQPASGVLLTERSVTLRYKRLVELFWDTTELRRDESYLTGRPFAVDSKA